MPIVRWVKEVTPQGDGGSHVVVRYFDGLENQKMESFFADQDTNIDAKIEGRIPDLNEQLAADEFEAIVGAA